MEESTFWILAAVGVAVFIFIFLEPIAAMFEDDLENEEEKFKLLLKNTTDDYLNSVLESAGMADIVTKKKAVVNRPHKKTGNWKVYIDYHLSHPVGVKTKLLYQVEDEVLNRKLKNENIEVNLKPKLTEQELQMLMAYMQKAAMETATAQAPMEEEMMTSETIMAANGGIMNNKRGLVDGPGGYAGESVETINALVEPRGNPAVVKIDETFEDGGDKSILEISDEQSSLMQGGEQYKKEY